MFCNLLEIGSCILLAIGYILKSIAGHFLHSECLVREGNREISPILISLASEA